MKIRISTKTAAVVVDMEEKKAGKVFRELAGQLMIFGISEEEEGPDNKIKEEIPEPESAPDQIQGGGSRWNMICLQKEKRTWKKRENLILMVTKDFCT